MLGAFEGAGLAAIALEEEAEDPEAEWGLEVDEDSSEALDFVEDVGLGGVQVSKPLHVDWAIDLTVEVGICLYRLNDADRMPLRVEDGLSLRDHAAQHALSHHLLVAELQLLSCEVMVHLQALLSIVVADGLGALLVVEQQVDRQNVLLEDLLQLTSQNQGQELVVLDASIEVVGARDEVGEDAGDPLLRVAGETAGGSGRERDLLPLLIELDLDVVS